LCASVFQPEVSPVRSIMAAHPANEAQYRPENGHNVKNLIGNYFNILK
jgi:hypothetical protein